MKLILRIYARLGKGADGNIEGLDYTMVAFDSNVGGQNEVDSLEFAMTEAKQEF